MPTEWKLMFGKIHIHYKFGHMAVWGKEIRKSICILKCDQRNDGCLQGTDV